MAHWSPPTPSRSPASRSPGDPFAGSLRGRMPSPDPPPLGIASGLPLIPCPECGGAVVEEYIPGGLGGTAAGNPSCCRRNETGVPGGCSFFKTKEEYEAILRDRGLLGPEATPEPVQGRRDYLISAPSGLFKPEMFAVVEDLKNEMVALNLAIAQLKTDIEDSKGLKGKLGAGDKVQKVVKTDTLARWAKAIVKWLFWANVVVLLFCIVVAMSV